MLRRTRDAACFGGAYVFPGGAVDAGDGDERVINRIRGMSDTEASVRLDLTQGALTYWAAGVRECFEEAGMLIARAAAGILITPTGSSNSARRVATCMAGR